MKSKIKVETRILTKLYLSESDAESIVPKPGSFDREYFFFFITITNQLLSKMSFIVLRGFYCQILAAAAPPFWNLRSAGGFENTALNI